MAPKAKRDPLMVSVWCELGRGDVWEEYLIDCDPHPAFLDGHCSGKTITINPIPAVVDALIHELLHRLHPEWSENYVRNRTTFVLRRMTDDEIQRFYGEYQKRKRTRKVAKRVEDE